MTNSTLHKLFGGIAFLGSFIVYTLTVAPTTSFWDPGEFIAVAHGLQVNHPPGAPFYSLVGRIFSMAIPLPYVALSINMISVLSSAMTVLFLYWVTVRLLDMFVPSLPGVSEGFNDGTESTAKEAAGIDSHNPTLISMLGALIGAATFAVTDTFWFNAVEAEVYAPSMFFTGIVVWLALRWSEDADTDYANRWILLIAYMFGLALGVHLLNLLALFFVAMIIYFKKYEFSIVSFLAMVGIAAAAFVSIYPIMMFNLTDLIDNISGLTLGLIGPGLYIALLLGLVAFGIWYTHKKKYSLANLAILSYALVIVGFSTYFLIFIRAQADPPINENDPSTPAAMVSFLKREQYGSAPLIRGFSYNNATGQIDQTKEVVFPRRHSSQARHLEYYAQFDSDIEYFIKYQINHMYWRYFAWNFIGRDHDVQDAGWNTGFTSSRHEDNPAHTAYFFIPLALGLIGMTFHARRDPKRAFSVFALFILTGLAIIVYLNQSPYEPRERDYAYVGSYFAFAIWIGMGAAGLLQALGQAVKGLPAKYGLAALLFLASPVWMGFQNWESHDRTGNYVARDYAWNLLQSVEPNAILFTNGDNDTFPLWYLQEVEGVRTDVRIVCLSLLNTEWYIKQMRDLFSHESRPLPISYNDIQLDQVTGQLSLHQPGQVSIPVDKNLLNRVFNQEPGAQPQEWTGVNSTTANFEHQVESAVPFSLPVEELDDAVTWNLQGRFAGKDGQGNDRYFLQTQDIMILDILQNNQWLRPVYFANTVSGQSQLGLRDYFQYEGKAFRVVPKRRPGGSFGTLDPAVHEERLNIFKFTEFNNTDVYYNENIRRMMGNYRFAFTELSDYYMRTGEVEKAREWLVKGLDKIPFRDSEDQSLTMTLYAYRLLRAEAYQEAYALAQQAEEELFTLLGYDYEDWLALQDRVIELEDQANEARMRAQIDKQREYSAEKQSVEGQVNSKRESLVYNNSVISIVQNVYYVVGQQAQDESLGQEAAQRAQGMIDRMNAEFGGQLGLPSSIEQSNAQVRGFNLGI